MDDNLRYFMARALMHSDPREELPARQRLPKAVHRCSPVGDGKTQRYLQGLAERGTERVVMSALTNRLASQNMRDLVKTCSAPQTAQHYVGNDYVSEDGSSYACHEDKRQFRALLGKAGGDVYMACGYYRDDEGLVQFRCPHGQQRRCMISKQLTQGAGVIFTSTTTLQRPMRGASKPTTQSSVDELTIDETLQPFRRRHMFAPDVLTKPLKIIQIGSGNELTETEIAAAMLITLRSENLSSGNSITNWDQRMQEGVTERLYSHDAYFQVLAIRKLTEALNRLTADPAGGRVNRYSLPRLDQIMQLKKLFSHTLLERPDRHADWANPSQQQVKQISRLADLNKQIRRAAMFLEILLALMALPPMRDPVPGIRVLPLNEAATDEEAQMARVAVGHIIPINASYHTDEVTWLDATGSSALAQLTHFENVILDPPDQPLWDFGKANRLVKLMHRHDGHMSRWTAGRLFHADGKPKPLGWMTFVTIAHLKMEFLSEKGVERVTHGDLLTVTTKAVKEKMPSPLQGTEVMNFKAVNGSNKWKTAHAEAILLSPASTPRNYWEIVEAMDGRTRPDPGVWWQPLEHPVLIKDTDELLTTYINGHPDQLFNEYYREVVTSDSWQAYRLRTQWRQDPTLYIVANNEPLPPGIIPDAAVFVEDRGGWYHHVTAFFRIAPTLHKNGKFGQNVADVVAELLQDRFNDAKAVREHVRHRSDKMHETPAKLDGTHGFATPYPITIRLPGKSRTDWVVDASDRRDARDLLQKLAAKLPKGTELKAKYKKRTDD